MKLEDLPKRKTGVLYDKQIGIRVQGDMLHDLRENGYDVSKICRMFLEEIWEKLKQEKAS